MKYIITLIIVLFFISTISSQNEKFETIFVEYSKHTISFENPRIKKYLEKYTKIYHDMCTEKLKGKEVQQKMDSLGNIYKIHFRTITNKDKANLGKLQDLLSKDCSKYIKHRNLAKDKAYVKAELRKQNKEIHKEVDGIKISFENKNFEKFANQVQELSFKQCATNISQEDYHTESLKLRKKYKKAIKRVSKNDTDNLMLLNKKSFLKCIDYTIDKQYSSL